MNSVWAIAAAVALPPARPMLVMIPLLAYSWLRQRRPAGRHLYRVWFSGSTVVLACLAAGDRCTHTLAAHSLGPPALSAAARWCS